MLGYKMSEYNRYKTSLSCLDIAVTAPVKVSCGPLILWCDTKFMRKFSINFSLSLVPLKSLICHTGQLVACSKKSLSNCLCKFFIPSSAFSLWRCPWCNGYHRRKWTRRHEFKSWMRLTAFHIALIPLGRVWIQLFSLQLWVNCRTDWVLQPWWGN